MNLNRKLLIGILLAAVAGFVTVQNRIEPLINTTTPSITSTNTFTIGSPTPTSTPAYGNCAYMWAYRNSPELTEIVNSKVQILAPGASARADLFGEDCVYADGSATFGAMETDFYVQFPVENLTDEETFGYWVDQVLLSVVKIPEEEIPGNYGFVEFSFTKSETERIMIRVPIQKYINDAKGKTGTELFRFFYTPPVSPT